MRLENRAQLRHVQAQDGVLLGFGEVGGIECFLWKGPVRRSPLHVRELLAVTTCTVGSTSTGTSSSLVQAGHRGVRELGDRRWEARGQAAARHRAPQQRGYAGGNLEEAEGDLSSALEAFQAIGDRRWIAHPPEHCGPGPVSADVLRRQRSYPLRADHGRPFGPPGDLAERFAHASWAARSPFADALRPLRAGSPRLRPHAPSSSRPFMFSGRSRQ